MIKSLRGDASSNGAMGLGLNVPVRKKAADDIADRKRQDARSAALKGTAKGSGMRTACDSGETIS